MELLTVREAADELRVSPETVRRLLRQKVLKGYKLSRQRWAVERQDIDRFVKERANG